ncbi:MAG: aldolase/citrate lyase family protein [Verrucomicrobia bacterium]|nr:aldolase/citrate lyase family protein [Verrucomicrobiota bacterium]MDA1069549.1 aldolase/citrate lyase family protein [Verrucomicrobiota bacterium]
MTTPYSGIPNQLRQDLLARKPLIGCWCAMSSPIGAEILGQAGFDWLLIDGEHSANDFKDFMLQLMALKDSASAPVVRPQWSEPVIVKRLMDLGFYNFLFPFIETEEQAKAIVAATRYPPDGIRGVALLQRGNKYGYIADYPEKINENVSVLVQIESLQGLENVEAIAKVEGVDGLFIGPSDLSVAMGHFCQPMHPEVQEAMQRIIAAGKAAGKSVGIIAAVEEQARMYLEMGVNFVAVGADLGILKNATLELRKKFKS